MDFAWVLTFSCTIDTGKCEDAEGDGDCSHEGLNSIHKLPWCVLFIKAACRDV